MSDASWAIIAAALALIAASGGVLLFRATRLSGAEMAEIELPSRGGTAVNRTKALIRRRGFQFVPFRVPVAGVALESTNLADAHELILATRNGVKRLFSLRQLAYHHVAQGELAGEPYLVSF